MIKFEPGDRFFDSDRDWNEVIGKMPLDGDIGYVCVFSKDIKNLDKYMKEIIVTPWFWNVPTRPLTGAVLGSCEKCGNTWDRQKECMCWDETLTKTICN